jgi:ATP-dependent DNA ligase
MDAEGRGTSAGAPPADSSLPSGITSCILPPGIDSCILDGEIVVYNESQRMIEPFGSVQGLHASKEGLSIGDGSVHYLVIWFDCLELNGKDFVFDKSPVEERMEALQRAVTPIRHFVQVQGKKGGVVFPCA